MAEFNYSKLSLVLDLGSSKIRGLVGFKEGGYFTLVANATVPSAGIKEGIVVNLQNAAGCVKGLMQQLENILKNKFLKDYPLKETEKFSFGKVYVGLSASRLQGTYVDITRNLAHEEITEELMASMMEDAKKTAIKYDKQELISTNLVGSFVDDELVNDTVGRVCDTLQSTYHNVYVNRDVLQNLRMCLNKVGFQDVEIIPSVKALSNLVLTDEYKQGNVALVNLGAQVTSISVYHDGDFRYVYESSTGSDKVTKDLETLKIPTDLAERLKKNGNAAVGMVEPYLFTTSGSNLTFESEVIDSIIEDRMTKIIGKISSAIQQVFDLSDINTIILSGDGSKQKFLVDLMEEKMGCNVCYAQIEDKPLYGNAVLLGLLDMAQGGSFVIEEKVVTPVESIKKPEEPTRKRRLGTIKDKFGGFLEELFKETKEPEMTE